MLRSTPQTEFTAEFWTCRSMGGCARELWAQPVFGIKKSALNYILKHTCDKTRQDLIPKADPTALGVDPPAVMLIKEQTEGTLGFQEHKLPNSFQLGFAVTWELTQNTWSVQGTPQHTLKQNNYDSSWWWSWDTDVILKWVQNIICLSFDTPLARSSLPPSLNS